MMATLANATAVKEPRDDRKIVNLKVPAIATVGLLAIMVFYRTFQRMFAWTAGLDSTDPVFDTYWMGLLKAELILIPLLWVGVWSYIWFTRDKNLYSITPREELRRYFNLVLFIFVYAVAVWFAASFFAEQDASWHQTVVRDTSFTPSHVVLFYGTMPLYVTFGVGSLLYATTRLPKYADNISIPLVLAVAGPFMILPNLGFNEWGHAFWMMEEVFTAPLHWGFVVMGWTVLALGGLLLQIAQHMISLLREMGELSESEGNVATS